MGLANDAGASTDCVSQARPKETLMSAANTQSKSLLIIKIIAPGAD
jgi:hypothetical protein